MARPLLIDTDPGCDDAIAILLALQHDALDVVGLTTVHGNAPTESTTRNARSILELLNRADVPVARGAEQPLLVPLDTAEEIHGEGGIRGPLPTPSPTTEPLDIHAAEYIVQTAREHDGALTLATIGRLTNVALALALDPELPSLLDEVVILGGAAYVPGNITPTASANFYCDPHSARRVIRETSPTVIGLDVTHQATLPADWIESIPRDGPLGESIYQWFTYYSADVLERYGIETAAIHDALAILSLVDELVETEDCFMEVVADAGPARGALICDGRGTTGKPPNGSVALDADAGRFRELVMELVDRSLT